MSEPTKQEYPVATIFDMARIPEDRLPAFMEELPEMLRMVRAAEVFAVEQRAHLPEFLHPLVGVSGDVTWVDDGAHKASVSMDARIIGGELKRHETDDWREDRT